MQVWQGVWLVPLTPGRWDHDNPPGEHGTFEVVIVLTRDLLDSEWLTLLCDTNQIDHLSVVDRIEPDCLVSPAEAGRVAALLDWMQQDATEIKRRTAELYTMSLQLGESYEEMSLLYKLSAGMTVKQTPASFFTEACRELRQVVGLRWMALVLTTTEPRLNELAGAVFTAGTIGCDTEQIRRIGDELMLRQLNPEPAFPAVINDTRKLGIASLEQIAGTLLIVPLRINGRTVGILFGGDKLDGSHISSIDSTLSGSLGSSLSIFLENAIHFDDMQAMFMGTLHALTASIDAKDSYTHGHSERVAELSKQLAVAAGLDATAVNRVYLSALIHDVGKIGVPESVLCKAGPLTDDEFDLIKQHTLIGAGILSDIRQMQDLIPGVLYHHERWDGRGYPHGLERENIPIFGRLICLADSFDAMSSNRTYRSSLTHDKTIVEIERCAGSQFDPQLAELFVHLDFDPFFKMLAEHQAQAGSAEDLTDEY